MTNFTRYAYRVEWSEEDGEHVALCAEFPSLSYLADTPAKAIAGVIKLVQEVTEDMVESGESVPEPLAAKNIAARFRFGFLPPNIGRLPFKPQSRVLVSTV